MILFLLYDYRGVKIMHKNHLLALFQPFFHKVSKYVDRLFTYVFSPFCFCSFFVAQAPRYHKYSNLMRTSFYVPSSTETLKENNENNAEKWILRVKCPFLGISNHGRVMPTCNSQINTSSLFHIPAIFYNGILD